MTRVARSRAEVEALEGAWQGVPWRSERAEYAYFLAEGGTPFALLDAGSALVGRVGERRIESRVGYLRVYAPRLRVLTAVDVVGDAAALAREALNDVDAITVPALPLDSVEYRSLEPLARQRFVPSWTRRLLVLPATFDDFLASRSRKIRAGIRYDAKKLESSIDARVTVHRAWTPSLVDELDSIAATTYQRTLGAGFSRDRGAALRVALEHGWARAYMLHDRERPIAFWLCGVHRDTIRLHTTGYLPDYARYRPGIYLLMRVIEDSIADPALRVLDFGPGRSGYKRHFSNEEYEERNLVLFAPTLRAQRARIARTAIAGVTLAARRTLDAVGGTQRLKTTWRRRLRR
jgi:GNAT acetyltransferase-like protein